MSNPYDEIPYKGFPFEQTHPDRLATIARLFGMDPAPVGGCRMLELGCGDGGNLIPMAYTLPGSAFVGIDLGERGIAEGCGLASELGLRNVELLRLDIRDAAALGRFDYIVAHGVYSWTPAPVQEAILSVCRGLLNPQGVAYVSYSVYPGAHVRNMLAEMMKDHARHFSDPRQKIEQARAMMAFLSGARKDNDPYSLLLRQKLENLWARNPNSIFHDELSDFHEPLYFREFAARAARHRLQYLGEADFHEMQDCTQPPETIAQLRQLAPDLIEREQHLDYLKCRRFRQTLLCHDDVRLDRALRSEQARSFWIRADQRRGQDTPAISDHPLAAAMNVVLQEVWPAAVTFDELLGAIRARAGATVDDDLVLQDLVLAHVAVGLFQLGTTADKFTRRPGPRPRASALVRTQAKSGPLVTNLIHRPVMLEDEQSRVLAQAMDGTRDRRELLDAMPAAVAPDVSFEKLERGIEELAALALFEA